MRHYGSNRKDKTGLYFISTIIFSILTAVTSIWAVVEFILYLVKDNPFNWTSVWLLIAAVVLEIYFFAKLALNK